MTNPISSEPVSLRYPPFAAPGRAEVNPVSIREGAADSRADDDLRPIEHFVDDLPLIDIYLAEGNQYDAAEPSPQIHEDLTRDSEGWAVTGWQSYDWSRLASLGSHVAGRADADSIWNTTEWAESAPDVATGFFEGVDTSAPAKTTGSQSAGPTADEIAAALDGIAQRIRSGELSIDQLRGMPPEAAMAAALAAMMRLRG